MRLTKKTSAILVAVSAVLFLAAVWSIFPLVYLSIVSFAGLGALPTKLELPRRVTLDNWKEVLVGDEIILPYMLNSFYVALVAVAITLCVAVPAAYSFSRYKTRTTKTLFHLFLFFRMLPYISLVIPIFFLMKSYGLLGTRIGLSLTHLVYTVPLSIWLMKGYFDMLSPDMEEAALIDGANRWQVIWKISIPLSGPGMAVTGMFAFLLSYIEFLFAVILTRKQTFTVPVHLAGFMAAHETYWRLIACSAILSLIPMIVLFTFLQKYLARGFTLGALK